MKTRTATSLGLSLVWLPVNNAPVLLWYNRVLRVYRDWEEARWDWNRIMR